MHTLEMATPGGDTTARWRTVTLLAFRFSVVYLTLWVFATQMSSTLVPFVSVRHLGGVPPLRDIVSWTATHIFGVTLRVGPMSGMGGDTMFDWVQVFCLAAMAALISVVWSVLDRERAGYIRLRAWSNLFVRFALGATLVQYGMTKAVPLQMAAPSLSRFVEPFGHFSPMGVLWTFMGASPAYQIFTGVTELAAASLLLVPVTATVGSLLALAVSVQIFALNMSYDVAAKLLSFHLILMSLFLLAPQMKRLFRVVVLNTSAEPARYPSVAGGRRAARLVVAAQILFGAYLFGSNGLKAANAWTNYGGGAEVSPLYGIWDVEELAINGVTRLPLVTDYERWRRVIFDDPAEATFQRMDDTFVRFVARIDTVTGQVTLRSFGGGRPPQPAGTLIFTRPAMDRMILEGELAGQRLWMQLQLHDKSRFVLANRGFNWVQEAPFNR